MRCPIALELLEFLGNSLINGDTRSLTHCSAEIIDMFRSKT